MWTAAWVLMIMNSPRQEVPANDIGAIIARSGIRIGAIMCGILAINGY